jgi:undecaprenyl-diphosphatase
MHELIIIIAKYFIALSVLALIFTFFHIKKDKRLDFVLLLLMSAVITIIIVKLATTVHQDPRPFVRDGVKPFFISSQDNGFPSDHTAFSALTAFVVYVYSRKLGLVLIALSLLIGFSRVVSGVHHAQDIIGGFIIAGLSVGLSVLVLNRIHSAQKN